MKNTQTFTSLFLLAATTGGVAALAHAQEYPFQLPARVTATMNVDTSKRAVANPKLLSLNMDTPRLKMKGIGSNPDAVQRPNQQGKRLTMKITAGEVQNGYDDPMLAEFTRQFRPNSLRWPQGVWANFYDYNSDGRRRNPAFDNKEFSEQVDGHPELTYGFDGFKKLHDQLGFDVLWTFNLNDDTPAKSAARLRDRRAKGFDVTHIELGNEQFWASQRGVQTATPEEYTATAQKVSRALKAIDPNIKLGIPLSWRRGQNGSKINHDDYNKTLTADKSYFDAIIVHRYVHIEKDKENVSAKGYREILTSPIQLAEDVAYCRSFAPDKKIWLSEWGISAGPKAASYLGAADAYMYLFENQDVYEYSNWFQINAYNPFVTWDADGKGNVVPMKTGFGAVHQILRDVYEGSTMLGDTMQTTQLAAGSDAVVARAVVKNGVEMILAVNKTPQSVPFTANFNGRVCVGPFEHKALAFDSLSQDKKFEFYEDPLTLVSEGKSRIVLPPYSISVISTPAL